MARSSKHALEVSCIRYACHVLETSPTNLAVPLCKYIMSIPQCDTYHTIMVVERPYFTDIYPDYFSAMSYHESYSGPTPATLGVSELISEYSTFGRDLIEEWFRDSWMYLRYGILLINVCCSRKFIDASSIREKLESQLMIRSVVANATSSTGKPCTLLSMGNPAKSVVSQVLSSLGGLRKRVVHKNMPNPAILSHDSGDSASRRITEKYKGTLRYLAKLIEQFNPVVLNTTRFDCYSAMSEGHTPLSKASADLSSDIARISAWVKSQDSLEPQTVGNLLDTISKSLESFSREVVKADINLKLENSKKPKKPAQPSSWGNRPEYKRAPTSRGIASQTSGSTKAASVSMGGFADDEDEQGPATPSVRDTPARTGAYGTPSRVNHTPSASRVSVVTSGFADDDDEDTPSPPSLTIDPTTTPYMRLVGAYVHDMQRPGSAQLESDITHATQGKPTTPNVMRIATLVKRMMDDNPDDIARVLGMSSDTVDECSELVQLLDDIKF